MKMIPTPQDLRSRVPADAELSHILPDLRALAVPVRSLLSDPRNARKHNTRNLETVRASIASYRQRKPVVVNSRTMIVEAGNGTLEVFRQAGLEYIAAVFSEDDAVTASGYGLADNRSAELAEWNDDVLGSLLRDLSQDQVDVGLLGWSEEDMALLLSSGDVEPGADKPSVDPAASAEDESLFWPEIRMRLPSDVMERWSAAMVATGETLPHLQVSAILRRALAPEG